ncbi:hypothetical protein, partial [Paenibacillus thiaminolyticus]|uniref:hypothetical protein n=1 Tax=Paenibacillus thiaminolyticus TaxID=49283 RepID=UPI001C72894B
CGRGEKAEITSKPYLFLLSINTAVVQDFSVKPPTLAIIPRNLGIGEGTNANLIKSAEAVFFFTDA